MRRVVVAALLAVGLSVGLTACSTGYKDLPLPGSNVRGDTYEVTAVFDQALNLAQGAQVKVNGVSVGRVQTVTAKDFQAYVTMDIEQSIDIPEDSTVRLRYDTPLGELIVQVTPGRSEHDLGDGDMFAERRTTTAPSVEDALASTSMLINGGHLGELQTIASELNTTLGGRESEIRASLERVTSFLHEANASRDDINRALVALRSVSEVLAQRRGTIRRALHEVGPAVETLGKDTDKVVALLGGAESLARTAKRIALQVDDPLLTILQQLGPIADQVLSTRSKLRAGLDDLVAVADQLALTVPSDTLPLRALLHMDETQFNVLGGSARTVAPATARAERPRRGELYLPGLGLLLGGRR